MYISNTGRHVLICAGLILVVVLVLKLLGIAQ
jgi:hypothetical protein